MRVGNLGLLFADVFQLLQGSLARGGLNSVYALILWLSSFLTL